MLDIHPLVAAGGVVAIVSLCVTVGIVLVKLGRWLEKLETDRQSFRTFMKTIGDEIAVITKQLTSILQRLPEVSVTSASPLQLTEFGHKIAQAIDGQAWAEENARVVATDDAVFGDVLSMDDFEVDAVCARYVAYLDPEYKHTVDECAYQMGTNISNVQAVLKVLLRDALLQRRVMHEGPSTREV